MAQSAVVALLDGVALVDSHHHFWELDRFPYRWLAPEAPPARFGDKGPIRKDYLPETYLRDMGSIPLSASVHVQANCGAADHVEETRWLQDLSERTGWPTAAVAEVDLSEPGAIALIDRHRAYPILRGVRTPLAWDAEGRWRVGPRPGLLSDAGFREAARHLADHDLCLDMVVVPEQLPEVADFAGSVPELRVVVNHFGTLEPSRPGNVEHWQDGICAVAARPNIFLKLSGLWTLDKGWNPDVLSRHVDFALDTLGSARIMYGSNLPIEGVNCPLERQVRHLSLILAERPTPDIASVFSLTARVVYRL